MKKLLFAVFGLCIGSSVFAESPQVQYIKRMYKESVKLETKIRNNGLYYTLKYFDSNIRKLYDRNDEYGAATEGIACIDYDVLWQINELNPKARLTFTEPRTGMVKVTIGATKDLKQRSVTYQVKCQKDGKCKITEIFERGKPFTKKMSKCLDDFYRTEIKK